MGKSSAQDAGGKSSVLPPSAAPATATPTANSNSSSSSAVVSTQTKAGLSDTASPVVSKPSRSWTRHLNCTNFLSTVFLAYAAFSMGTLYRIAVPSIPPVVDEATGRRLPAYEPLWAAAPGLALEIHLSTKGSSSSSSSGAGSGIRAGRGQAGQASDVSSADAVHILTIRDLPYAWNLSEIVDLDLGVELAEGFKLTTTTLTGPPPTGTTGTAAQGVEGQAAATSSSSRVNLLPAVRAGDLADAVAWLEQHGGGSGPSVSRSKGGDGGAARGGAMPLTLTPPALGQLYDSLPPNITTREFNQTVTLLVPAGIRVRCLSRAGTGSGASGSGGGGGEEGAPAMAFAGHEGGGAGAGDSGIDFTDIAPLCVRLARAWRSSRQSGAGGGPGRDTLNAGTRASLLAKAAAGDIVRKGFLPTLATALRRSVGQVLGSKVEDSAMAGNTRSAGAQGKGQGLQGEHEGEEEDGAIAAAMEYAAGGLLLAESSSEGARKVARALAQGQPVYAHATVRWQDTSQAEEKGNAGARTVASPLSPQERRLSTATKLTSSAPYQPGRPVRFLWADVLGGQASETAIRVAQWMGLPEGVYRQILARPRLAEEKVRKAVRAAALSKEGAASVPLPTAPSILSSGAGGAAGTAPAPSAPGIGPGQEVPHWLGSLSLTLVMQTESIPKARVPPEIQPFLSLDSTGSGYSPLLTSNPVRPLRDRYVPLNSSLVGLQGGLPLKLRLSAISAGTWRLMSVMDQSLTTQRSLGATEKDTDDVIRLLAETPLWLLALTFAVSFIHLLFDVLAFKNDVSFWASAKSLKGISVRSLGTQFVSQCVISLYLWREGSSLLVLIPQGAGTVLLLWKMAKASGLVLEVKYHVLPLLRHDPVLAATASEGSSSVYDRQAVGTMTTLLLPLLAGYSLYTLLYAQHASWADWALGTAVSAVYSLGFALMTPQLWINYKLRSVAHLPWRVLGYRFFNTIIDDLFAAIIRMPLLHRISVFRDDIIFVIYMVQRCLYPVDSSRPAEGYEDGEDGPPVPPQLLLKEQGKGAGEGAAVSGSSGSEQAGAVAPVSTPAQPSSASSSSKSEADEAGKPQSQAEAMQAESAQPVKQGGQEATGKPSKEKPTGSARPVSVAGVASAGAGAGTGTGGLTAQVYHVPVVPGTVTRASGKGKGKGKGGRS